MSDHATLLAIFAAFVAAKVAAELFEWLHLPPVIGELLAGVLVGPSLLGWVRLDGDAGRVLSVLAELGVIVLLFEVGLRMSPADLRASGKTAGTVAVTGVVLSFGLGFAAAIGTGHGAREAAFVATALTATSAGIAARVLGDMRALDRPESRIILSAAVIDDVLGLLVLVVVGIVAGHGKGGIQVVAVLVEAIAFVVVLFMLGPRVMDRLSHLLERPRSARAPFLIAVAILLGLSVAAQTIGLAAIVGAFLAGTVLSGTSERYELDRRFSSLGDLLTPFFFVVTGARIELHALRSSTVMWFAALITVAAVVGKLAAGVFGARGLGRRRALLVGMGMVPHGEVGVIVAGLALREGIAGPDTFAAVLVMVGVTTIVAAPLIHRLSIVHE